MPKRIRVILRKFWRKILQLEDTPQSIAASVAIGLFIAWTPTIGLQMTISFFICWAFRVNRIAGPLLAWVTNPLTIVPVFYMNYLFGQWLLPARGLHDDAYERISHAFSEALNIGLWDYLTFNREKLGVAFDAFWAIGADVLTPMIVGSVVMGLILAAISYPLTLRSVRSFQSRREAKRNKWHGQAGSASNNKTEDQPAAVE